MIKRALITILIMTLGGGAHAGLMDIIGGRVQKEPATLADACDSSEIKRVCPEMILGDMSVVQCLGQNIQKLSTQCATYIKKAAGEKLNHMIAGSNGQGQRDASSDKTIKR